MTDPLPHVPGAKFVGVPAEYRDHPLLRTDPYFTVPRPLLTQVVSEVDDARFDAELLRMEMALSDVCEDHSSRIGFWRGEPIGFMFLRPNNSFSDTFVAKAMSLWGKSEAQARAMLATAGRLLDWMAAPRRGYCGWLMTNPAFLEEHRQVLSAYAGEVAQDGIPEMGAVVRDAQAVPGTQLAQGRTEQFLREFEEFFVRWRLDGVPAPFLPQPMGMHLPVLDLRPVLGHMRKGGKTFYVPDIYPIPSRDTLHEILEDALRNRSAPDHLREWFEIVNSENVAKNQIPRHARLFEMQHYMRALYSRHVAALHRKKSAVVLALAWYFKVSDDTVERDLSYIDYRLGPTWCHVSA